MDTQQIISKLVHIETWATGLANEASGLRKELQRGNVGSSSASRKGRRKQVVEAAVLKFKKRVIKSTVSKS
jgi:hypothetical protein